MPREQLHNQKPDHGRAPMPFALQMRMTEATYRALAVIADKRGQTLSAVVRGFVTDRLDQYTDADGRTLVEALTEDPGAADEVLERMQDADARAGA